MSAFNGIDTFIGADYLKNYFTSKLTCGAESRSILRLPDINALLTQLLQNNFLSKFGVKSII